MEKTQPLSESEEVQKTVVPNAWKFATYISFMVIAGLLTFNIFGGTKSLKAGDIQSLVILPFDNFTGDEQLENMVSGMHSLLIGDMGRIGGLRVLGNTTSNKYKEVRLSAPEIAAELNVDAVLEATVMCLGDSVCMQFRLVSTTGNEEQLWVSDYREDKSQILNLFNRITRQVAEELIITITPEEERLLAKSRTVNKEALDEFLKINRNDFSREMLYKYLEYLNNAAEKEPDWALIYGGLAGVWVSIYQMGLEPMEIAGPKIYENLNKALELDPDNAESHAGIAMIAFLIEWDWEKAETEYVKALAINPSDAGARIIYAQLLCCLQRYDEALIQGRLAIELDPLNPFVQILYGAVLSFTGDFKTALTYGEKVTADDPGNYVANVLIGTTAFKCGDYDKSMEAAKYYLPGEGVDFKEVEIIYEESGFVAAHEEVLRQLEVLAQKGYVAPAGMAQKYMMADQPDKAMEWLEKGFESRSASMPYIATQGFFFEPLFDNPRFVDILEKMNLPLPNR
jgi:TolB-like protein/cytochrome c-type biogenesis protein CcmH/NrfG